MSGGRRRSGLSIRRFRLELLLLAALSLPILDLPFPRLRDGASLPFLLLPGPRDAATTEEDVFKEAYLRLLRKYVELQDRHLALGEPSRLVPLDSEYWDRHPLRIEASVIGRDAHRWRGSLVLSAGRREGIRPGLPVVVGERLVGTVAEVQGRTCRVRLLTDAGHRLWVEALSEETRADGVLVGTGEELIDLDHVRAGTLRPGLPVFSGGGDPLVPRGLLVGSVVSATDVDRDGRAEVLVRPSVLGEEVRVVNVLAPPEDS